MKGYCSWCLTKVNPILVSSRRIRRNIYECPNCKQKIVECQACKNFARWDKVEVEENGETIKKDNYHQFCGEHQHVVPNFETLNSSLDNPADYKKVYKNTKRNLAKLSKVVPMTIGSGLIFTPVFYLAAPAVGGAIGVFLGYSGAVATNVGLAFLGGGSLASGGLGMAGGTMVVTAIGTSVGSSVGAYIGNAYLGSVKDFDVIDVSDRDFESDNKYSDLFKTPLDNDKPLVISINGFLSQKSEGTENWENYINHKFKDIRWFHVNWEAKKLYDIGKMLALAGGNEALKVTLKKLALSASKQAAKKIGPLYTIAQLTSIAANPWHTAMVKAEQTGVILADIIRRCSNKKIILVGHSLGARVIYSCLSTLATTNCQNIKEVHLMGGAVSNKRENWIFAKKAVSNNIYNYYSTNDKVLKYLFSVGTFFREPPIGRNPIQDVSGIVNIDVSDLVKHHMDYKSNAHKFYYQ